jgi:hypothetical protein
MEQNFRNPEVSFTSSTSLARLRKISSGIEFAFGPWTNDQMFAFGQKARASQLEYSWLGIFVAIQRSFALQHQKSLGLNQRSELLEVSME